MPVWLVATLISLAFSVVGYIIAPKPKGAGADSIRDLETPTAESGVTIGRVFGTVILKSPQFLWVGEKGRQTYTVKGE